MGCCFNLVHFFYQPFLIQTGLVTQMIAGPFLFFAFSSGQILLTGVQKKQHTIARSSTEAEYRSLAVTAAKLAWLRVLLRDLSVFLSEVLIV